MQHLPYSIIFMSKWVLNIAKYKMNPQKWPNLVYLGFSIFCLAKMMIRVRIRFQVYDE